MSNKKKNAILDIMEIDLTAYYYIRRDYSTGKQISRKYRDRHTEGNNEKKIINSPQVKEGIKMKIKKYLERKDKNYKIIKACKTQQKLG